MKSVFGNRRSNRPQPSKAFATPFEAMESRTMMAAHALTIAYPPPKSYPLVNETLHVTNTNTSGAGSLAAAINTANSSLYLKVTIDFQLPANSVIHEGASAVLPPITRSYVTIDGTAVPNLKIDGTGGGILGFYIEGSNDTFKGLEADNFSEGFASYAGSHNTFVADKTYKCNIGMFFDSQSSSNRLTDSVILASTTDGFYVGGTNNIIGALSTPIPAGYPRSVNVVGSNGNGIDVANSGNQVVSAEVSGASKDALLLEKGGTFVGYSEFFATGGQHGSAVDVLPGANYNQLERNLIHYNDSGASAVSYALKIQSTGNDVSYNSVYLNGSTTASLTGKDVFLASGNSFNP